MSNLPEGIVTTIDPPMGLVKLEGDAVFAMTPDDSVPRGAVVLDCELACYRSFRTTVAEAGHVWTCTCDTGGRNDMLHLKLVIQHGDYYV